MSILNRIRERKLTEISQTRAELRVEDIGVKAGSLISKKLAAKNNAELNRETKAALKADTSEIVQKAEKEFASGVEETINAMREAQTKTDIILDESQLSAVAGILHNKVSVLIGAAGTGKTTVTRVIVAEMEKRIAAINLDETQFVTAIDNNDKYVRILRSEAIHNKYKIKDDDNEPSEEMPGIAFAAYTGRASQQLRRALPKIWQPGVSTIHSLLGYAPQFETVTKKDNFGVEYEAEVRRFRPSFDASCKLPFQVYILDEASMIPIPLFNELIDAIHDTSRILLIGDIHQLPPVYGKSVLGYAMRKWPVFELTTIHRQAEGNAIISNAHRVLQGKPLENAINFHLIGDIHSKTPSPGGQNDLQQYMLRVVKQLADLKRYDPYKDAIIVPQNKGLVGCDTLNEYFVTMFNPEIKEHGIIINKRMNIHTGTGHRTFAIRDKVMIVSNINNTEPPITNGMIGIIESINLNGRYDQKRSQIDNDTEIDDDPIDLDMASLSLAMENPLGSDEKAEKDNEETEDQRQSSHVMTIKFENGQTFSCSTAGDYRRVKHGYAATCHKSQGGEYPNIIILCHSVNARMLSQEWLYTAITRARNNVYIICNDRGLSQALGRQNIKGNTIKEKIRSYVIETGSDEEGFDTQKFPILWQPEELK